MKIFHLPDLGEGLAEAEIREWYVKEGESVAVDQPLVSMETAKAVVDVPSPYKGKIIKLHGDVNAIVPTGAPLITFETNDAASDRQAKGSVVGALEESSEAWKEGDVVIGAVKAKSQNVKAMPAARVLAKEMNVDLATVTASGPQGLITPDDVKKYLKSHHQNKQEEHEEKLHGVRRVMAQTMAASQREIVPVTIVEDADISDLPEKTDITVKLMQAIIAACKSEPSLNAWFDGQSLSRKLCDSINIGMAVDTPEGLFVPVINNAQDISAQDLRKLIDEYKQAVKARQVKPADFQGATISLSNFGTITGRYATPIIVPPAVAILGAGRTRPAAVVRDQKVIAGKILPLSLTFDHRAVTGGEATRFLGKVIEQLTH